MDGNTPRRNTLRDRTALIALYARICAAANTPSDCLRPATLPIRWPDDHRHA